MMNRDELQRLFHLENDPMLFETALSPRSCGGNAKYERLALYGDSVLDMHLYDYLFDKGLILKGQVSYYKGTIHQKPVIKAFAEEVLGLSAIMSPLDKTYSPEERDMAETFEALLGSSFQVNGLGACKEIVYSFIEFALNEQRRLQEEGMFDLSRNYIGELLEMFPGKKLNELLGEPTEYRLPTGRTAYQIAGSTTIEGITYDICTSQYPRKRMAQQEAAYIVLCKINGEDPKFDPAYDIIPVQEKTVTVKTSITSEELVFCKPSSGSGSMEVSTDNGELLVDWAERKAKKDAYKMLVLLSSRADDVRGAPWICDTSEGVLALVTIKLGDEMHFAIGVGPSNSKARTSAAEKLILESNIFRWLEEHYPAAKI
ncbi:ribonuclease III [Methanolobus psychrophilus R15]|nr:ribonuclease III [Methanolobus psychrophilus R15]